MAENPHITTKKDLDAIVVKVNETLCDLNRINRVRVDREHGYIKIAIGTADQINNGHAERHLVAFNQPRQAEQYLNGFLEGLKQPQYVFNPNYKIKCSICGWFGTYAELKTTALTNINAIISPVELNTCPNCDSHKLIGI